MPLTFGATKGGHPRRRTTRSNVSLLTGSISLPANSPPAGLPMQAKMMDDKVESCRSLRHGARAPLSQRLIRCGGRKLLYRIESGEPRPPAQPTDRPASGKLASDADSGCGSVQNRLRIQDNYLCRSLNER